MLPPGVESWNDVGNNEAYLAGKIGYTHNAFSVYAAVKRDNNPVFGGTVLLTAPKANNAARPRRPRGMARAGTADSSRPAPQNGHSLSRDRTCRSHSGQGTR